MPLQPLRILRQRRAAVWVTSAHWQRLILTAAVSFASCMPGRAHNTVVTSRLPAPELELARQLPAAADECVVARPNSLEPSRAAAYGPVSQAELWVWQATPQFSAYARAAWTGGRSRRWIALLRFDGAAAALRASLAQRTGLMLDWQDDDAVGCSAEPCPIVATFLDAHTVRLVHGAAVAEATTASGSPCAQLLQRHPTALEVSWRREHALFTDATSELPLHTQVWSEATSTALNVERDEWMADRPAAERALMRDGCRELWGGGQASVDALCERTRQDSLVHTSARLRWQDLEEQAHDEARHARAARYAAALAQLRPNSAVDWSNVDDAWRELEVRRTLLEASSADLRPGARELLRDVQRALDQHPAESRFLKLKAELQQSAQVMTTADSPAMTPP
jgi:hypothetical protein